MGNKLLTVAVPSYNMEEYLDRCINSLIVDDDALMSELEIIVVNDGSGDKTSEIAHSYAEKYPDTIKVIDKNNGHYGSCINAAIQVARGKYFRILDADDWFENEILKLFLIKLKSLDVDCVCTSCYDHIENEVKYVKISGLPYEEVVDLDQIERFDKYIHMHHISYRTSLLREMKYEQTEGICYTDEEFSYYPLVRSKTIYLIDLPVYHYYIGRVGQSVDREVSNKIKHHYFIVAKRMILTPIDKEKDNAVAMQIRQKKLGFLMSSQILPHYVLFRKMTKDESYQLSNLMNVIKFENRELYDWLMSAKVKGIPVYKIWKKSPYLINQILYSATKRLY